jgi:hypothetical protein
MRARASMATVLALAALATVVPAGASSRADIAPASPGAPRYALRAVGFADSLLVQECGGASALDQLWLRSRASGGTTRRSV